MRVRYRHFVAIGIALAAIAAIPVSAQQDPGGSVNPRRNAPAVQTQTNVTRPTGVFTGPPKICFWHDTSAGTAFGKSGYCPVSSSAAVGTTCRCSSNTVGRPNGKYVGKVMLAPQSDGSTQVVR